MEFDFDVSKLCELEEDLSTVVPLVIGVLETSCYDAASGFFFLEPAPAPVLRH